MKEVKIYTIVSDQLSPPITGESFCTDMVRHSDYADLEEKCAALAAHLHKKFGGTGHIGVSVMALEWLAQEIRKGGAA